MGQAIGIDFGATNTVVTYLGKNNHYRQCKINGRALIPSVIYFKTKNDYTIGYPARRAKAREPRAGADAFKIRLDEPTPYEIVAKNGDKIKCIAGYLAHLYHNKILTDAQELLYRVMYRAAR